MLPIAYADSVIRSAEFNVSFRYPDTWSERESQLHTTVVLLYADDGSGATCNITVGDRQERLAGLSEDELDALRQVNHTKEYFVLRLTGSTENFELRQYWRGRLGQKEAGFVHYERDIYLDDKAIRVTEISATTFANGRRYTFLCNGLLRQEKAIKTAFNSIRRTLIFTH